jgi:hypothetical protein
MGQKKPEMRRIYRVWLGPLSSSPGNYGDWGRRQHSSNGTTALGLIVRTVDELKWTVALWWHRNIRNWASEVTLGKPKLRPASGEAFTTVTISGNTVIGQGRTNGAAENSIQIGFGATGKISSNVAMDDVWAPDTISDSADAASGILVFASAGVTVSGNTVGNIQFGIAFVSDPVSGPADGGIITGNRVSATHIFDGIELCSSSNAVHGNTLNGSAESAIHVDSSCGPVMNNVVSGNTVNDACAGIMVGTAAGSNSIGFNAFFNARHTVLTADRCTPPLSSVPLVNASSVAQTFRPSPARP